MKKVSLISLGCSKNLVDSENILGLLKNDGYEIVNLKEQADIIFINTCGFINSAKKESLDTIFDALKYKKKVVIVGCLAQRYETILRNEIPEADLIIPIRDYNNFNDRLKLIDRELNKSGGVCEQYRLLSTGPFSAYLRIGDGCDNRCSYCAIPLIRGRFHSRPITEIKKEAASLAAQGVKEIIVLEQDTSKYGADLSNGLSLIDVLQALLDNQKIESIRLLYLYPDEVSDALIDFIANHPRVSPYFDIPIQHSESRILKAMNRRGDKRFLRSLFNKIRQKIPNAVLRTTIMVGFPSENNRDFKNLLSFLEEIRFDHLGAFSYSREEDTPAYQLPHQVREKIKQKRLDILMKHQQKISYQQAKKHIGETMEGYVVGKHNDEYLIRTYWNAPDDVDGSIFMKPLKKHHIGDKIKCRITQAFVYDLLGEEI